MGAVVSDWYDPVVGWNRQADSERGRIYRIAPAGHRQQNKPLNLESGAGAIAALKSPNLDARYLGWQALHDMGMEAIPHLDPLYAVGKPHERARALWLLSRIKGAGEPFIDRALDDPDASTRVVALRAARQLNRRKEYDLAKRIEHVTNDPSPRVLTEAAIALRDVNTATHPNSGRAWPSGTTAIAGFSRRLVWLPQSLDRMPRHWLERNPTPSTPRRQTDFGARVANKRFACSARRSGIRVSIPMKASA